MTLHTPSLLTFGAVELVMLVVVSRPVWQSGGFAEGARSATAGAALVFVALPLLALRGTLPDVLTYVVANSLMLVGAQLLYQIGYALYDVKPATRWDRWATSIGIALLFALEFLHNEVGPDKVIRCRVVVTAIPLAMTAGQWLWLLGRAAPRPRSLATRYLMTASALAMVIHGLRAIVYSVQPQETDPLRTPAAAVAVIALLCSALLTAVGYILHLESRTRDRLHLANDALTREALTDPLTGLGNRRRLELAAVEELARAKRHSWPMTVLVLDIDHFKRVNDQWGHAAGDAVLQEVAKVFRTGLRPHDVLVRWGGEEFALLLPHCDMPNAEKVARRILSTVRSTPIAAIGGSPVAVSIGIAVVNPEATALLDALQDADAALYRAKRSGRDRYSTAIDLEEADRLAAMARSA